MLWTMARFFLYASYFTIFGVLFGFKNFGKMVAVDNVVNGLFGAPPAGARSLRQNLLLCYCSRPVERTVFGLKHQRG